MGRAWRVEQELRAVAGGIGHQSAPAWDHLALRAGPGADARVQRPAGIVGIAFLGRYLVDPAFDAHHPLKLDPVKLQRGVGVAGQRLALAAVVIGVPDDAALIQALDQHHPGRWSHLGIDRSQGHRVGLGQLARDGFMQPPLELLQRIGMGGVFVELGALVAFAQVGDGSEGVGHESSIRSAPARINLRGTGSGVPEHTLQQLVVDTRLAQALIGLARIVQRGAIAAPGMCKDLAQPLSLQLAGVVGAAP